MSSTTVDKKNKKDTNAVPFKARSMPNFKALHNKSSNKITTPIVGKTAGKENSSVSGNKKEKKDVVVEKKASVKGRCHSLIQIH